MSLTLAEARVRAALVSDVSYDLTLDLTGRGDYACRATIRFACADEGAETFVELAGATEVLVDGLPATTYDGRRIHLCDLRAANEVTVEARIPYVTDGDGMHTFTDPADGETYVGAYVGMDLCQRIFPCFDQNDLKAPVTLTVVGPGRLVGRGQRPAGRAGRRRVAVRDDAADPAADVHGVRRAVALGAMGARRARR